MRSKALVIGMVCGAVAAIGSLVLIAIGHRPWQVWITLAVGLSTVMIIRTVARPAGGPGDS